VISGSLPYCTRVHSRSLAKSTRTYGDVTPLSHNVTYV